MPNDTIRYVSELLLKHNIGAVVVMKEAKFPVGLVTKTDILKAYKENLTLDHTAEDIMSRELEACEEHTSRDQAARIMERNKVRAYTKCPICADLLLDAHLTQDSMFFATLL
jgi:CBS domain-containing protein